MRPSRPAGAPLGTFGAAAAKLVAQLGQTRLAGLQSPHQRLERATTGNCIGQALALLFNLDGFGRKFPAMALVTLRAKLASTSSIARSITSRITAVQNRYRSGPRAVRGSASTRAATAARTSARVSTWAMCRARGQRVR